MGWPQIIFGAALIAALLFLALYYGWRQVVALRRLRLRPELPDEERRYQRRQAVGRLVNSVLLLVLAALDLLAIRRWGLRQFRKLQADRRAMIERQAARLREGRNGHS